MGPKQFSSCGQLLVKNLAILDLKVRAASVQLLSAA
jgi:hypothetical protein